MHISRATTNQYNEQTSHQAAEDSTAPAPSPSRDDALFRASSTMTPTDAYDRVTAPPVAATITIQHLPAPAAGEGRADDLRCVGIFTLSSPCHPDHSTVVMEVLNAKAFSAEHDHQ